VEGGSATILVAQFTLQVALILCAARFGGEVVERWLRQPAVLGELATGIALGPFAFGAVPIPGVGPLLPLHPGPVAVSAELYALAQLGSIVLLFVAGLETDLRQFLRFGPAALLVAAGGVVAPFTLGTGAAVWLGLARAVGDPHALFLGAILTATSVGITARVLGDLGRLDTPEGVTILAAAVIDDVFGILLLALVVGAAAGGGASAAELAAVGGRAVGAWLGLTGAFLVLASAVSRLAMRFRAEGAGLAIALATGFLGAYLAERAGLALIIGAYSAGLALSTTPLKAHLDREMRAVYHVFVPIFFVVTGMLVDLRALGGVLATGVIIVAVATIGKLIGCGLPALAVGFNRRGALRIGIGMLPRGEVALVVATVGLTAGLVDQAVFGAAVLVAVATTLLAPPLLVPSFRIAGGGRRGAESGPAAAPAAAAEAPGGWVLTTAAARAMADALDRHLLAAGFQPLVHAEAPGEEVIQYRGDGAIFGVELREIDGERTRLRVEASGGADARLSAEEAVRAASAAVADELLHSFTAPSIAG
jgi:Kef-type K+ transport system membrane component KefB